MGRKSLPKRYHKKVVSVSLKKELLKRIDECRGDQTRSEFISGYLEGLLYSDKSYCSYRMRQAQLEMAFWEFEFKKAEDRIVRGKDEKLCEY